MNSILRLVRSCGGRLMIKKAASLTSASSLMLTCDTQQADHLPFGGQGIFGENTKQIKLYTQSQKQRKHRTLIDKSWKETWNVLYTGVCPFPSLAPISCCAFQLDHWQMGPSGNDSTSSSNCYDLLCFSSDTSQRLFPCSAFWFVLLHVIIFFFELLLSYYRKEESPGRTNLKSSSRHLWKQHCVESTAQPKWRWRTSSKPQHLRWFNAQKQKMATVSHVPDCT